MFLYLLHYHSHVTFKFPHNSLSPFLCHPPFPSIPPSPPPPQGSSSSGRTRSFSLLPHLTPSSSPGSQRHLGHTATPSNIVTITHHKSPAAARRAKSQYPGRLLEVKEVGVEGITQTVFFSFSFKDFAQKGSNKCRWQHQDGMKEQLCFIITWVLFL